MSKKLLFCIITILIVVIIIVFLNTRIFVMNRGEKPTASNLIEETEPVTSTLKRDDFIYKSFYKNPFITFSLLGDSVKVDTSVRKQDTLLLKGIVLGPGEPVAVIEDIFGNISILKKGETFNDVTILSVQKDKVKVRYKKRNYTLHIWEE
jgi:predicted membrane protein